MAQVDEHLIPIRLDIEHDQYRLKDTFMWNVTDTVVTPELFALSLCDDFNVPPNLFVSKIVSAINERIAEYKDQIAPLEQAPAGLSRGKFDPDGEAATKGLIEVFRKAREEAWGDDGGPQPDLIDMMGEGEGEGEGSVPSPPSVDLRTDPGVADEGVKIVVDGDLEGDETMVDQDRMDVKREHMDLDGTDAGDEHNPMDDLKTVGTDNDMEEEDDVDRPMTVEEAMSCLPFDTVEDLRVLIKVSSKF
jgi:hypothetical protein